MVLDVKSMRITWRLKQLSYNIYNTPYWLGILHESTQSVNVESAVLSAIRFDLLGHSPLKNGMRHAHAPFRAQN